MNTDAPQNWKIWCILENGGVLEVEINPSSNVGSLKKAIKDAKPNRFSAIDADELILTFIEGGTRSRDQILKDKLSSQEDLTKLRTIFPDSGPSEELYYFIVEALQQGMS
jgi:hypothetical protein